MTTTGNADLPALPYRSWRETKDTLHLWAQIVGKVQLGLARPRNHWWHVPLLVSARGLATTRLPAEGASLELELDLRGHRLAARTTHDERSFALRDGLSVAGFYEQLTGLLAELRIDVDLRPEPFGVPMDTPFPDDREHHRYDPDAVTRFHEVLVWADDVLDEFAGWFSGKASPVHVFWHSFDLAYSRFSGLPAPPQPDVDPVTAEAYSHEVVSFGFWAGDPQTPTPTFYSYTAPEPAGLREHALHPAAASWTPQGDGSLAVLAYDEVRAAADPRAVLLAFLQSAYEAGATTAGWDLAGLRTPWSPPPGGPSTTAASHPRD